MSATASGERDTKNPGMSCVLIGSITSSRPAALNSRAAYRRLAMRVRAKRRRGLHPRAAVPEMQFSFGTPSACAYSMPRATPSRNSASRPGRHAMPKSPLARSPMGRLHEDALEPVVAQPRGDLGGGLARRAAANSTRAEARGARGGEAVEEVVLGEEEPEVRGEAWHHAATIPKDMSTTTAAVARGDLSVMRRLAALPPGIQAAACCSRSPSSSRRSSPTSRCRS